MKEEAQRRDGAPARTKRQNDNPPGIDLAGEVQGTRLRAWMRFTGPGKQRGCRAATGDGASSIRSPAICDRVAAMWWAFGRYELGFASFAIATGANLRNVPAKVDTHFQHGTQLGTACPQAAAVVAGCLTAGIGQASRFGQGRVSRAREGLSA